MARKAPRDIEKAYPRAQFVAKLRRLADAIESAKPFSIRVARESLRVPADAIFNIEHERSGAAEELEFQLKWTTMRRPARRSVRG
jgi:amphi-Trp domain-containing protein